MDRRGDHESVIAGGRYGDPLPHRHRGRASEPPRQHATTGNHARPEQHRGHPDRTVVSYMRRHREAELSRVNYICRLASISFAGSPPRLDALLGCVGAVAGDVKLQDDGVVHDPVNRRRGGHGVGEDAFPLREDQV